MLQHIISKLYSEYNITPILSISLLVYAFVKTMSTFIDSRRDSKALPLVPYKYPFLGSTLDYYKDPRKLTEKLTNTFGPRFRIHFHGAIVTVVGADDATEVFSHPDLSFVKSQEKYFSLELIHGSDVNKVLRDTGVPAIMRNLMPNLNDYSKQSHKEFLHDIKLIEKDEFEVSDVGAFMKKFISRSSASVLVGSELCRDKDMFNMFENSVTEIGRDFMPGALRVLSPTYNKLHLKYFYKKSGAIEKYRSIATEILEARGTELKQGYTAETKSHSVISYVMNTSFPDLDEESIHILTTILIVFIFVAAHATSEAITYVAYCLAKHTDHIPELREEQDSLLSSFERSETNDLIPTPAACRKMVKLDSFIQEALRIRKGGIGLAHTNITDHDVVLKSGAVIKPGEEVLINLRHVNFDKDNQGVTQDLETFDGFRYVDLETNSTRAGHDNIIFGLGRHTCPGRWFALYEIKSILSYFIRNYDMEAADDVKMVHLGNTQSELPEGAVKFIKRQI